MAEKKESSFTVTDRRLFTPEGELRKDVAEESVEAPKPSTEAKSAVGRKASEGPASKASETNTLREDVPPMPTAAEQQEQADAYKKTSKDLDARVELSGHSSKDLEMTFERFMASLYMTAMLQLGLMHEEGGQPRVDLIGARQTIDTLSLLADKTKGNLTATEEHFLQNCLYELRMAYVEVTNSLARPPQNPAVSKNNPTVR
jgi:Domain of unknown function (DUF1844)